jgi:hypothetical protein
LAWLAVLLVGLPAALVYYIGWPLPGHWPSRDDWQQWVQQPLTRTTLLDTFAVLVWLLWAVLVYAIAVEIATRVRRVVGWLHGRRLPPLPTPMQAAASGLLGAAVFSMPTGTAHPPAPSVATPPAAGPVLPAADASVADRHTDPGRGSGVELPDGGWVTDHTASAVASVTALVWLQRRRRYLPRAPAGPAPAGPVPVRSPRSNPGLLLRARGPRLARHASARTPPLTRYCPCPLRPARPIRQRACHTSKRAFRL